MKTIQERVAGRLEGLDAMGLLELSYSSLVSPRVLATAEDCDRAERKLSAYIDALDIARVRDRDLWKQRFAEGLEAVRRIRESIIP